MRIVLPVKITPELAEETGWHIGDGSMNIYDHKDGKKRGFYQLRGHIEDDVEHYMERIKPIFKQLYNVDISLRTMPKTRVFGFQLWNCDLVNFKHKLGLCLGKKFDISIPKVFLKNNKLKKAVVRGIFDTDGGIYLEFKNNKLYPRMCITTISQILGQQIFEILNKIAPQPLYIIDEIARSKGHEVIRTPPYHPELQPIEICWGVVKNHIGRNCDFTMKNLIEQLDVGFDKVTTETCIKIIAKIRKIEDSFWTEDIKADE